MPNTDPLLDTAMTSWLHVVSPVINDVHRRFRDHVDRDDLLQEAALWWYGPAQKYLERYLTEDANHVRLRRSLWRACAKYAQAEKAHRVGYRPVDQVRYAAGEIVALLPIALDPDGLPEVGHADGPKPKGNLAEGGDVLASIVDIRRALGALTEDDVQFLTLVEDCRSDWPTVAGALEHNVLADSARRRHARIVERMARFLNNEMDVAA
jgi:hypothetical protein